MYRLLGKNIGKYAGWRDVTPPERCGQDASMVPLATVSTQEASKDCLHVERGAHKRCKHKCSWETRKNEDYCPLGCQAV